MPNLPTVSVTQAQADRILQAFGGTVEVAVPAYKDWLIRSVREYVLADVQSQRTIINALSDQAAINNAEVDLPPEPPIGPIL